MMFAMGLRLSFTRLVDAFTGSGRRVAMVLAANFLLFPLLTLVVILLAEVPPFVAVGFLILGVCPAAPYGPPFTAIAKGNFALATGLMILLAGTSVFLAPLLFHLMIPLIPSGNFLVNIDPWRLLGSLLFVQLLPLGAGLALGEWKPLLAEKIVVPAGKASKVLNLLMITAIAFLQMEIVLDVQMQSVFLIILMVSFGAVSGWFAWDQKRENRISTSIVTAMRNMSLSMGIAATSFAGTPIVTTVLVYSFIAGFGLLLFSLMLRWSS
jgi:BASS family bile acid:Na+ symporter